VRSLALDIGEKRVGVAVSDRSGRVATPVRVLGADQLGSAGGLRALVDEYEPASFVIGLPLSMDGTEGPQAARVRVVAEGLGDRFGLPVEYVDERLTSVEVSRAMREAGLSERDQRGKRDAVAAALMLQTWLDARSASIESASPLEDRQGLEADVREDTGD
jgi:putative Holliday junction resolvase